MIQFIKDLIDLVRWKRQHFQNHTIILRYADGRTSFSSMSAPPPRIYRMPMAKIHADPNKLPGENDWRLFELSDWSLSESNDGHHIYVFEERA